MPGSPKSDVNTGQRIVDVGRSGADPALDNLPIDILHLGKPDVAWEQHGMFQSRTPHRTIGKVIPAMARLAQRDAFIPEGRILWRGVSCSTRGRFMN